ncbi:MAG: hypothetical protein ACU0BS_14015 [Hasllibacter sp.]
MSRAISEAREEAFLLYGLTRALRVLQSDAGPDVRDGTAALIEAVCERAGRLALRLDAIDAAPSTELARAMMEAGNGEVRDPHPLQPVPDAA